jgi:serine/threonine-protein kinase RsbW
LDYRATQQKSGAEIGDQEPVSLRVPSSSEYVLLPRLVVSSVGETAGFGAEDVYDLKLAVTEAVTNVIQHAAVESMLVEYRAVPGMMEVSVIDSGAGFNVEELRSEPGENGGFGLNIIRSLVDEMDLDSNGSGTTVKITRYAINSNS